MEQYIKQVVDKLNLTYDEVKEIWNECVNDVDCFFPDMSGEEKENRLAKNFFGKFRDISKVKKYLIFCYAKEQPNFRQRKRIEKVITEYNKNPEECLKQGLVKLEEGVPVALDNIQYWDKERTQINKGYGQPLDADSFEEVHYLAVKYNGEWQKATLKLKGKETFNGLVYEVPKLKIPMLKMGWMSCNIFNKNNLLNAYVKKISRFNEVVEEVVDMGEIVNNFYPLTQINEIKSLVLQNRENKTFNALYLIEGQVVELNLTSAKPYMRLMTESLDLDDSTEVRVSLKNIENIDFGEFSIVRVLGNPWVVGEEDNEMVGMTAFNLFVMVKSNPIVEEITSEDLNTNVRQSFPELHIDTEEKIIPDDMIGGDYD